MNHVADTWWRASVGAKRVRTVPSKSTLIAHPSTVCGPLSKLAKRSRITPAEAKDDRVMAAATALYASYMPIVRGV